MENLFKLANRFCLVPLLLFSLSCVSSPDNSGTSSGKPAWVDNVNSVYNKSQFVAAVGYAANREMAEKNALTNLAAFFGQSIKADQTISNTYYEAVRNGVTAGWSDNIAMQNKITTSVSVDTLIGAEINEVWHDIKNNIFYAVASMERTKTIRMYTDMILDNIKMINNLTTMSQTEKSTLEAISRYQFAATVADINVSYANLLMLLNAPISSGVKRGDEYRHEMRNITKDIPIDIIVTNDRESRIQSAFVKVFSDFGFKSGGTNPRYTLRVNVKLSPVEFPNNSNKFVQMELNANLIDSFTREALLPFTFNNREGHLTLAGAENRAFLSAEEKIINEYNEVLIEYFSKLLPER